MNVQSRSYKEMMDFDRINLAACHHTWVHWIPQRTPRKKRGSSGANLLLARASTPEQEASIGKQTGGRVFLFLSTDDFWRDYNEMLAVGIKFVREPKNEPYGTVAVFDDLYGNLWDLIELSGKNSRVALS